MIDRMTNCLCIVRTVAFFTALLVLPPGVLFAADGSSSEVAFVELYVDVIRAIDAGKLDRSISKKAHSLNSELQKEINATDARLETLKADSGKLIGMERDALLDELVAAGAKKERIYLDYRQRLEQLVGSDKLEGAATTSVGQATGNESQEIEGHKESSPKSRSRTVKFESVPEDVTTGDFD